MNNELENYLDIIELRKSIKFNTLFLEITNVCNYKCKHCYNLSGEKKALGYTTDEFSKIIFEFMKYKIKSVILSGGEALLHTNIWNFIDILRAENLEVTLLTNGRLLSNENAEKLKSKNVNIQISLDGATMQTNDSIRHQGSFSDVISALKILKYQNYTNRLSVNTVICNINYKEIHDIIELCEEFSVSVVGFNFLNNLGRAKENELFLSDDELYRTIRNINKSHNNKNIDVKVINVASKCRFCSFDEDLFLNPVVDVYGNVYMCEFLRDEIFSIGNIFKQSLEEITDSEALKRNLLLFNIRRYYIHSCRNCAIRDKCSGGCIVQNNNNNYFSPQLCKLIKKNFVNGLEADKS
ncbi:MAG: radical SAM protein [Lachnospiraceae bacterium]|nr:radical SAM protein [Lachnospiraceae bacterium]